MYCEIKNNQYWVWSSRVASLDCIPQFKFNTLDEINDKILSVSKSKVAKLKRSKADVKAARQRKAYEKSQEMRSERIYSWAANLNNI